MSNNKSLYIGITIFSIIIIIIICVVYYVMYKNGDYLFKPYSQSENKYVVNNGENGLQFINIPSGVDLFIDSSSEIATKKNNMINLALSNLQIDGTNSGIVDMEPIKNNNYNIYILLIIIILLIIGGFICYVAINEDV